MRTAGNISVLVAVLLGWFWAAPPAAGQRVQFATPVQNTTPQSTWESSNTNPPSTTGAGQPSPYNGQTGAPSAPGLLSSPPSPTYSQGGAAPGGGTQPYSPQPSTLPQPSAAPGGAVQPPPADWDPYATPGGTPSALLPTDPYFQSSPNFSLATAKKFIQHIDLDYHWFAGHGDHELGIHDMGMSVTCAFPMFYNSQTPLLVTPGFFLHSWDGPVSVMPAAPGDPWPADLPPRTYDAYLDAAWNPQVTQWFGGELNFRIGIYSDFNRVSGESIRYMGKGLAVLQFSPSVRIKAGAWYLDRNKTKLLPAGGICWTPNPDVYFDILFPNPEVGKRLTTWGNTDWWMYFSGDYGGGSWTIKRDSGLGVPTDGEYDSFDYNDIRFAVGLRFETLRKFQGKFEVGFSCARELIYRSYLPPAFYPHNTVYVGGGVSY